MITYVSPRHARDRTRWVRTIRRIASGRARGIARTAPGALSYLMGVYLRRLARHYGL